MVKVTTQISSYFVAEFRIGERKRAEYVKLKVLGEILSDIPQETRTKGKIRLTLLKRSDDVVYDTKEKIWVALLNRPAGVIETSTNVAQTTGTHFGKLRVPWKIHISPNSHLKICFRTILKDYESPRP